MLFTRNLTGLFLFKNNKKLLRLQHFDESDNIR